uniref:NIDO domain-containing protein n=1 Tax=Cyprinus carpio carpio TaxID=630221 RepID=A0A8C1BYS8_CYPCA
FVLVPSNFLPFGNGEIVTPRLENGSSEVIKLQQPFKFFGRTHNQTFVNNNGHLTFTEPLPDYIPLLNSGRDIIAPLWTQLDNRRGGTISCREDRSSAVLALVTAAIDRYFPNITFVATSAFVATWDSVPYQNGEGVSSNWCLSVNKCCPVKVFHAFCWYFEGGHIPSGFSLQHPSLFHPHQLWRHCRDRTNVAGEW